MRLTPRLMRAGTQVSCLPPICRAQRKGRPDDLEKPDELDTSRLPRWEPDGFPGCLAEKQANPRGDKEY